MMNTNAVARLIRAGAGTEVWWDSSPLVYEAWLGGPGRLTGKPAYSNCKTATAVPAGR